MLAASVMVAVLAGLAQRAEVIRHAWAEYHAGRIDLRALLATIATFRRMS